MEAGDDDCCLEVGEGDCQMLPQQEGACMAPDDPAAAAATTCFSNENAVVTVLMHEATTAHLGTPPVEGLRPMRYMRK